MPSHDPLIILPAPRRVRGVVVVAHGGSARSEADAPPWSGPALRLWPFTLGAWLRGAGSGVAAAQIRYRRRGWNDGAALEDGRAALEDVRRRFGDVPVALIGHSMGGRLVLRLADDPSVTSVCALAPWLPPGEPVPALAARPVLVLHGGRDRITDPAGSLEFALRARAAGARISRFDVRGSGHAMLERALVWQRMARRFALATLGVGTLDPAVAAALDAPSSRGLRVPV